MGKYSVLTRKSDVFSNLNPISNTDHTFHYTAAEQVEFFLDNGYVVIKEAFTTEKAAEWSYGLWIRLGLDPNDKSAWTRERIHMPWHKRELVSTFSPRVRTHTSMWRFRSRHLPDLTFLSFLFSSGVGGHAGSPRQGQD